MHFFYFGFKVIILFLFLSTNVLSDKINEVLIDGNQRISDETIKMFSQIPENNQINQNKNQLTHL